MTGSTQWDRRLLSLRYGFVAPDFDGMMNGAKCQFLWNMVERYKGQRGIILEIGSWQGCSTTWLAVAGQRSKFKQLIAIDLFTGTPSWGLKDKNTYDIFQKRMARNHVQDFVKAIVGHSKDVIKTLKLEGSLSILHVDGDHAYDAVKADFDNYAPLLERGGTLIVDDYDALHPDVVRATDELLASGAFKILATVKEIPGKGYGSIALTKL